ncbi:MAG: MBL fold metallo-hydrolase [Oscillospiraceae bacterium]|nr:MBL fold metallo-hydrolase [Oscillospiraceae bacterium]
MKQKLKGRLKKAVYIAVVSFIGYVLVHLGIVDAKTIRWSDGYPVTIQTAGDTVSVISTGQSDSALISSGGKFCLIDAGETYSGHIGVEEYLRYAGVKEIELLVITHFHYDHTSELLDIMDSFKIKNIVIPNLSKENVPTDDYFKVFLSKVEQKGINLKPAVKGNEYTVGNGKLTILADTYNDLTINDTSVAALFTQGEFTYLSTGDGEAEYEKRLLDDFRGKVTVLAAGHHGSGDASTEEFIKAVMPDFVAISAGKNNDYGHPHKRVTELFDKMGIPYAVTAQKGTIVYSITENKLLENGIL